MKQHTIKVTVMYQTPFWVAVFERISEAHYAVARNVFGGEPTDPELYDFILKHYDQLKFSGPQEFNLIIKRKNPKRMKREVKREMKRATECIPNSTYADEALRLELEKNKKLKKTKTKAENEAEKEMKFLLKQKKRKEKHRGH
jgi:hypothetical protein